jgi:hypothetical protein
LGNAWIYECLASYRGSAARYLREVTGEFESPVAAHLLQAAALYEQISGEVLTDATHTTMKIAPYPGGPEDGKLWTTEMRHEQVRRLEAALPLERAAIAEIEAALTDYEVCHAAAILDPDGTTVLLHRRADGTYGQSLPVTADQRQSP